MNEISNFVDGSLYGCEPANNTLDNPPYVPNILGGYLNYHTVCMSGKQFASSHYDIHNLHGFAESMITSLYVVNKNLYFKIKLVIRIV